MSDGALSQDEIEALLAGVEAQKGPGAFGKGSGKENYNELRDLNTRVFKLEKQFEEFTIKFDKALRDIRDGGLF